MTTEFKMRDWIERPLAWYFSRKVMWDFSANIEIKKEDQFGSKKGLEPI